MTPDIGRRPLIRNPAFLAVWASGLLSSLGEALLHVNAIGFALGLTHRSSGGAMAQILILSTLPGLLLGLAAGVIGDRINRQRIMMTADVVRAALIATLPLVAPAGVWAVGIVVLLISTAACFFGPARTALIPMAVAPERLVAANAWCSASGFLVASLGTAMGGWVLALWGLSTALWVNAFVYGLSALVIGLCRMPTTLGRAASGLTWTRARQEVREGLGLIRRHHLLRAMIVHYMLLMALASAVYIGLVGHAGQAHGGLSVMSGMLSAVVVGLVLGGVLAHRLSRRMALNRLVTVALSVIGVGCFGLSLGQALAVRLICAVLIGAGGALYASLIEATLQRIGAERIRSRVIAARGVVSGLAVLMACVGAGWVTDHTGAAAAFFACALVCAAAALIVRWVSRPWPMARAVRWALRQLGFAYFRLNVSGLQFLPAQGPAIVAGNHPNVLDGILLLIASPRPVRFLVAEELYFHRYLHWAFHGMGCIPVYRTRSHNGDALHEAVAALQRGDVIGIFPEGTTAFLGDLRAIRLGVALLALRTGAPVIPLGFSGSAEAYPVGTRVPAPRRISLSFGPPMSYARTLAPTIPEEMIARTLEDIRWEIKRTMRWSASAQAVSARPRSWKPLQVALSAMVICPLASFLQATSNPGLDPVNRAGSPRQ